MCHLENKKDKRKKKKGRIKENVKSLNIMSKGILWNKSLTISNGFIKIKGVLKINS
jgi:predicted KAP-like P-loop ATPase